MSPDTLPVINSDVPLDEGEHPVGSLPSGWALASLADLTGPDGFVLDGDWVETKDQDPNGEVRLIQLADLGEGSFLNRSNRYLKKVTADRLRCTYLAKEDVLIARMAAPLGRACVFPGLEQDAVTAVDVCIWRAGKLGVEPRWLMHMLNSPQARQLILGEASGTTRQRISGGKLKELQLPVAPVREQRRIVARIDELFAEIAEAEAALERARRDLETWRRALLKAAVTGDLTRDWREANLPAETGADLRSMLRDQAAQFARHPGRARRVASVKMPDIASLPVLPDGWVWASLMELAHSSSYGTSVKCSYDADGALVLRIPNVRQGRVDLSDAKRATRHLEVAQHDLVSPGDVLVVRTNGSEDLIGRATVVTEPLNAEAYFASYLIRFRLVGDLVLWRWIACVFNSPEARRWIGGNIASSAGQYNISQSALARMPIPLPPIQEMSVATERVGEQLEIGKEIESALGIWTRDSSTIRQSILKAAFGGQLVLQDPMDEPASVLLERLHAEKKTRRLPRRRGGQPEAAQGALAL